MTAVGLGGREREREGELFPTLRFKLAAAEILRALLNIFPYINKSSCEFFAATLLYSLLFSFFFFFNNQQEFFNEQQKQEATVYAVLRV